MPQWGQCLCHNLLQPYPWPWHSALCDLITKGRCLCFTLSWGFLLREQRCHELPIPQEGAKLGQPEQKHGSCHSETVTHHHTHYFLHASCTKPISKRTAASWEECKFKGIYERDVFIMCRLLTSLPTPEQREAFPCPCSLPPPMVSYSFAPMMHCAYLYLYVCYDYVYLPHSTLIHSHTRQLLNQAHAMR